MKLEPRVRVVVTGAGSGLGRGFCLELARHRARVLCADISFSAAEETSRLAREAGAEAEPIGCDVSRPGDVGALARNADERWCCTDLVVNNAGVAVAGRIGDVPPDDWTWLPNVNLMAVIHGCHSFVPRMRKHSTSAAPVEPT